MCGVFGVATSRNRKLAIDTPLMQSMRDLLAHRGPDDAGLIPEGHIARAHRRLTLLDREGGAQPCRLARRGSSCCVSPSLARHATRAAGLEWRDLQSS